MGKRKKIVVFSGAGMSAESGLKTFRDSGGLWEQYDIHEVATPEAWEANPELVLDFYNQRRQQVLDARPNLGHKSVVDLEKHYDVTVVTQNIDDLHERAGSSNIIHLHGEILKARSIDGSNKLYDVSAPLSIGDYCTNGHQLRPHVVWFGENVPEYDRAKKEIESSDILLIIGTSLNVYPAAGLVHFSPKHATKYLVDPDDPIQKDEHGFIHIKALAGVGVPTVVQKLLSQIEIELQG